MVPVTRIVLLLLLALAASGWWLQYQARVADVPLPPNSQIPVPATPATQDGFERKPATQQDREPLAETREVAPTARPGASPVPEPNKPVAYLDLEFEHRRLVADIATWRFTDYRRHSAQARIEGEMAYKAYLYLKSCVTEETTASGYEQQLAQIQVLYARNQQRVSAAQIDGRLNQLEVGFERCEGLGESALDAAVEWLQLAADLAYLPAQIGFHKELPELLRLDPLAVYRRPDYLDLYQQRTPDYLDAALTSGHPLAFMHYAMVIAEGIVFERDPVLMVAFYHAADLADGKGDDSIQAADPASGLGALELREARMIGEDLCRRYCR